jgi:hypothetical protein
MVDSEAVQQSAQRLVVCVREVALARAEVEHVVGEQASVSVEVQRAAVRRWQMAEDREHDERARLAGLLDVSASDLIVSSDEVLYRCEHGADEPKHRRGTMPPEYTIYRGPGRVGPAGSR